MNDMQLAMVKSGLISEKYAARMEAEDKAHEREQQRIRDEQEKLRARNQEISRKLKAKAEQLEAKDDAKRKRDAHRRYLAGAPRRKPDVVRVTKTNCEGYVFVEKLN